MPALTGMFVWLQGEKVEGECVVVVGAYNLVLCWMISCGASPLWLLVAQRSHISDHLGACDLVAASFSCDFCL